MQKDMWFSKEEIETRLHKIQCIMAEKGQEFLLAFEPETVTYFTGYFTNAYKTFQFAIIPQKGEPLVFFRDVEEYYFKMRCAFDKFAVWKDADDPIEVMKTTIKSEIGKSKCIAIEKASWQLNAERYEAVMSSLPGATFTDFTRITREIRFIKSEAEISYQRKAALAAEAGMAAAVKATRPGLTELDIAAAVSAAFIHNGTDMPGPGVLSSGERAKHLHGSYTDRVLELGDTVQLETTPSVRHYHARFMRTIKVGKTSQQDMDLIEKIISIQNKGLAEVGPGVLATVPDKIIRDHIKKDQLAENYTNRTFYSVGLLMPPNGMETLVATPSCTWKFEPGMTFHTYLLLQGFGFSETILITKNGYERLTKFPRELLVSDY